LTNNINISRFRLSFENCFVKSNDPYKLRIRHHLSKNWIANVLANPIDSKNKILIADTHEIADYNKDNPNQPLKILDERIITKNEWIKSDSRSDFLVQLYSEMNMKLRENGLLDQIVSKYFEPRNIRPPPLKSDPVELTFDHVGVTFKICGAFLMLAFIILMKEITFKKLKQMLLRKILFYFINRYF